MGCHGHVIAHGQTGARLSHTGGLRHQVARTDLGQSLQPLTGSLGAVGLHEDAAQFIGDHDGRIRDGVHAAADGGVYLAQLDLIGERADGLHTGGTGHLEVIGGRLGIQRGAQHRLPHQVEVLGVLHHRAAGDCAQLFALQAEARDQPLSAEVSMSWLEAFA